MSTDITKDIAGQSASGRLLLALLVEKDGYDDGCKTHRSQIFISEFNLTKKKDGDGGKIQRCQFVF